MDKIRLGIIFGGKSAEHEVSLQSAKNIIAALDQEKYEIVLIGMDKKGRWYLNQASQFLLNDHNPRLIRLNKSNQEVALIPGEQSHQLFNLAEGRSLGKIDVIFPVLHGPYGEDGTIQGLLKLANIPFVGAGVLGSAVGMDKDVMKRLLRDAGLPIPRFLVCEQETREQLDFAELKRELGLPFFLKPANLGSSVGISKVKSAEDFKIALARARQFDNKIMIEEYIKGREIECSVLGNEQPIASLPGEILPQAEFYSYEAKYIDEQGALLDIPAQLPGDLVQKVQELAIKSFQVLCCRGMARVDFFLTEEDELIINEINTIPGFTRISMYPKLWEVSGLPYPDLIDRLIELALEQHAREQRLRTSY